MSDRTPRATDTTGLLLGELEVGARIAEYTIEAQLATRGTGHVYAAIHAVLPRRATIKVLPPTQPWTRSLALELLREACIVDALDHPGIPRVYECGMLGDRRPWIASELVEGPSLAMTLEAGIISAVEVTAIVRDVADILDYAHRRGLVHRNIVPAAIVFPTQPRRFPLCLVDWSGARARDSQTPVPLLKPESARPYVAPEQLRGDTPASPADIYALGAIGRTLIRVTPAGTAAPFFMALLERMIDPDPAARPSGGEVRDATAWLTSQVGGENGIPLPIDDNETQPTSTIITSETSPTVVGEIRRVDHSFD